MLDSDGYEYPVNVQTSDEELLVRIENLKREFWKFQKIEDIRANEELNDRMVSVIGYLPDSEADLKNRIDEVRDVVSSGFSLIRDMKEYITRLRRGREERQNISSNYF